MPITTFLYDNDLRNFAKVEDAELNELFQEVRKKFDNKYYLQTRKIITKKFLRKPKQTTLYTLFYDVGNEFQVINFCRESLMIYSNSSYIMTYFFGLLNGIEYKNKEGIKA